MPSRSAGSSSAPSRQNQQLRPGESLYAIEIFSWLLFSPLLVRLALLMTIQEIVGPEHRLDEQAEALFRIRVGCDRPLRNFQLGGRWRPVVSLIKCELHSLVVITIRTLENLLR